MQEAGMLKRWLWRDPPLPIGPTPPAADPPGPAGPWAGLHPLVARLLHLRGLGDASDARRFLEPKLSDLHDPAGLPGADAAAARLEQAVQSGQPIVIYGDYDVDGITASAILWHVLTMAGAHVSTYVPHRVDEGYGLNSDAITQLASNFTPHSAGGHSASPDHSQGHSSSPPTSGGGQGGGLIISVDCGITAVDEARLAKELGVDLIITDHHEFDPDNLPDAHTIVHPCLSARTANGQPYPFTSLCGAGVAFKLAWHFARVHCGSQRLPETFKDLLLDLLSLAALGTVADVVPLVDENRIITWHGLGQIKRTRFAGLNALIDASRLRGERIDAFHVGFVLGPRLNACGRMGHAGRAVQLLTSAEPDEARQIADFLGKENERRRTTELEIYEQAHQMVLDAGYDGPEHRAIVLGAEGWHAGVVGIVASRLVEAFARPVVMLNIDNGEAHGSARSVVGVSIHDALCHCAAHLNSFGGHAMAAGLRMDSRRIDAFRDDIVRYVNAVLSPDDLVQTLSLDAPCSIQDVSVELWEQLQRLAPFGRDNPGPTLCLRDVQLYEPARRVGNAGRHLRLTLCDPAGRHDRLVQSIGFGMGDLADQLPTGIRLDVAFQPKVNVWQGRRRAEVHIQDVKPRR